jgi:hypothetical protein
MVLAARGIKGGRKFFVFLRSNQPTNQTNQHDNNINKKLHQI